MTDKDFQVTIKVRNARLLSRIRKCGFKTIADFARANGLNQSLIGHLAMFKMSPIRADGEWRDLAFNISSALHCEPEDIWPEHIARLKANRGRVEFDVNTEELRMLNAPRDDAVDRLSLQKMIAQLPDRTRKVIEQRFGFDGPELTYQEIANNLSVTPARIRQIELKTLRTLRRPSFSKGIEP